VEIKQKAFFVEVENKFTHQFYKGFVVDAEDKNSVTQIIISICKIDPLSYDLKISEVSAEAANSFLEDTLPNGDLKHKVIDEDIGVAEMVYNSMGNPYE
jgi:hypothetical protein